MEGLDGVGYHFVVIFNDNDWSPKTHHVEVGTGTHQARFGNGGQFSLFAYVAAAFGLHVTDGGVCHGDDRIESFPGSGKIVVQCRYLEVGKFWGTPAAEVVVSPVTA